MAVLAWASGLEGSTAVASWTIARAPSASPSKSSLTAANAMYAS